MPARIFVKGKRLTFTRKAKCETCKEDIVALRGESVWLHAKFVLEKKRARHPAEPTRRTVKRI